MAERAMTTSDFEVGNLVHQIVQRQSDVSRHMTERLSTDYLLASEDVHRHLPVPEGQADAAFAAHLSSVGFFQKALEAFKANPLVQRVLDSRLEETRKIVANLSQTAMAAQIKARAMAEESVLRETKSRLMANICNAGRENDGFLRQHYMDRRHFRP